MAWKLTLVSIYTSWILICLVTVSVARNVCEQFLTVIHSDWVTGKRGRRNSVGSLDSTIEVSLWGGYATSLLLPCSSKLFWKYCLFWCFMVFCIQAINKPFFFLSASISKLCYYQKCRCSCCCIFIPCGLKSDSFIHSQLHQNIKN